MIERTISDNAGKKWSVMVRRVVAEGTAGGERAWGLCFRLKGDHTQRTLMHVLPHDDPPDIESYSEEELRAVLEPHAQERAALEARLSAEAASATAAAKAANIAAQAAKAEALRARNAERERLESS
jgi:hypothetical protein